MNMNKPELIEIITRKAILAKKLLKIL